MGFCSATSKCFLLIINGLFWLCAAVLIYVGVKYIDASDGVLDDVHKKPALVAFGAGGLLFFCGLIGIIGAFAEKKVLLGIFSVFIVATLILFVFTSVTLFTKRDDARNETDVFLLKQFKHYNSPNLTSVKYVLKRVPRDTALQEPNVATTSTVPTTTTTSTKETTTSATTTTSTKKTTTSATTTSSTTKSTTTASTTKKDTTTPANTTKPATTTAATTTKDTKTTTPKTTTKGTTKPTNTTTDPATTAPSSSGVNSTEFIDTVQSKLECCGYTNYSDWANYATWGHPKYIPHSCCNETAAKENNKTCKGMLSVKKNVDLIYSKGCQKEVDDVVVHMFKLLAWVSIGLCLFVLICFCAAMYLMCRKKDDGFSYSSIVA